MKLLLALLVVAGLAYGGYYYYNLPPPHRMAADGTYFLVDYFSVRTDHGVTGWPPGTEVHAVPSKSRETGKPWFTDGNLQAEVPLALLTQDMDLAAQLGSSDAAAQSSNQAHLKAELDKIKADQHNADIAHANDIAAAERARQQADARRASTALDKSARATNGGYQATYAPNVNNFNDAYQRAQQQKAAQQPH